MQTNIVPKKRQKRSQLNNNIFSKWAFLINYFQYFLVLFVKDKILQEISEKITTNIKRRIILRIQSIFVLQINILETFLLHNKTYWSLQTKQIVIIKVDKRRRTLFSYFLHLFTTKIICSSENRISFILKLLFNYFTESKVDEDESIEYITKSNIVVFDVMVNDPERM